MITIFGFGSYLEIIDPSPFVLKVDVYCKMANIEHRMKGAPKNLQISPTGLLPFIEDEGKKIADSSEIVQYLAKKTNNALDAHLTEQQQGQIILMAKSLEGGLGACIAYFRWIEPQSWLIWKEALFGAMPFPLKWLVPTSMRKKMHKRVKVLGLSDAETARNLANTYFQNLSKMLGDKTYFFGDKVCSFDAFAYAFLAQVVSIRLPNALQEDIAQYSNLIAFCQRVEAAYYTK